MRLLVSLTNLRRVIFRIVTLVIALILATNSMASALSPEQKRVIDSGAPYFDVDPDTCSPNATYSSNTSNSVYVVGDSLTVGMNNSQLGDDSLGSVLTARGWDPSINAQGCRPLYNASNENGFTGNGSNCPTGTILSAFNVFETDKSVISTAGTVVVALGTNNYEGSEDVFKQKAIEYIELIRSVNATIGNRIFWVNTYLSDGGGEARANSIAEVVQQTGIQLIDYRAVAAADSTTYSYPDNDTTHNDNNGYINKVKFIADAIGTPQPTGSLSGATMSGGFDPLSLHYPDFPDEAGLIQATKNHITEEYPNSPFARNLQYVDQIFTTSKRTDRDINPLLVMAIAQQENGYGQANSSATDNNNYFGITQGGGYRHFDSVEEGIDYFVEKVSRHVSNPDGNYADVTNFYEYLSVHQIGYIAYPGEYPHPDYGSRVPPVLGADPRMPEVVMTWETNWNPGVYYRNSIELINKLLGLSLSTVPVRGASTIAMPGCNGTTLNGPGANGWDLPGEGSNPMAYYSQMREASAPDDPAVQGYYGDEPYGEGTIAGCGCGPTSWAMIVSTLTGNKVEPPEVAAWADENGFRNDESACAGSAWWWTSSASQSEQKWGVRATQITLDQAAAQLQQGKLIMVSVGSGSSLLSQGGSGHLLVMRAVTSDGKYLFADPSDSTSKRSNGGDGTNPDILRELGSSRTPLDAATVSAGLKGLFVVERI